MQSALVQQVLFGMQELLPAHALKPLGHAQLPPGVPHVSPVTVQSAVEQQVLLVMQVPLAAQALSPVGHEHVPPGPEHVWPEMAQSVVVQHVVLGMHWLLAGHPVWPLGHVQTAPGLAQVSPWMVQSVVVQQAPSGMQMSAPAHGFSLGGQLSTHLPLEQAWFFGHALPHVPQLFGSSFRFAQYGMPPASVAPPPSTLASAAASEPVPPSVPPEPGMHSVAGAMQMSEHLPPEQDLPPVQPIPHEPQFFGSVPRSVHTPLQEVIPVAQPPSPPPVSCVVPESDDVASPSVPSVDASGEGAVDCVLFPEAQPARTTTSATSAEHQRKHHLVRIRPPFPNAPTTTNGTTVPPGSRTRIITFLS